MFVHHIAIICSDRAQAVDFYVDKLGFKIVSEHVRPEKDDILLNVAKDGLVLELFIKPNAPKRVSGATGEARGLRHLAFKCDDVATERERLVALGIKCEPLRRDDFDGKLMTFFFDPDGLPLELHE